MNKVSNSDKRRKSSFWTETFFIIGICVYFGLRIGHFQTMIENPEDNNFFTALFLFGEKMFENPLDILPCNFASAGIIIGAGVLVCLINFSKMMKYIGTIENAHGDAYFEDNLDKYYREFVMNPSIIGKLKKEKITDKNAPRNIEGKRVYKAIKYPFTKMKKNKKIVEACKKETILFTNKICLSMDGGWSQRNSNSIVFGAAGAGKSRYFLKPNILQDNGSFVCTDPSGDILQSTGYFLEKKGYVIKSFNITDMSRSCRFNPLYYIREIEDIATIVNIFMLNTKGEGAKNGDGDFWDKATENLLSCAIAYLFEVCPVEQRNFANVLALIKLDKHEEDEEAGTLSDFDKMFHALGNANPASYAYQQYLIYCQSPIKTRNNIIISTTVKLAQLDIPAVKNLTYKDEMDLDSIGEVKTAVFLNIPQADTTYCWLTAMLYSLLFKRLYRYGEARQEKEGLGSPEMKIPVRFLIDECANVGKIPKLDNYIATCRKYRISIIPIFQDYGQVVDVYGKEKAESIVSNCDSFLFLGGANEQTVEMVQKRLGKTTVKTISTSYQKKGSNSESKQQTGTDLMDRQQIETMSNAECLLFIRALHPFIDKKYDLTKHPNYKYLSEGSEGKPYINPFCLEYEDELIEGVRIKVIGEQGYEKPKEVDSARKRTLVVFKQEKVKSLTEEYITLETQARELIANKKIEKAEKLQKKMETFQTEIQQLCTELNIPNPLKNSETEQKVEDSEKVKENPVLADAIKAVMVDSYHNKYEFEHDSFSTIDSEIDEYLSSLNLEAEEAKSESLENQNDNLQGFRIENDEPEYKEPSFDFV